jgi:transcription-repair coupling factor (superfamily II helicase)
MAYAYLMYQKDKVLPEQAEKRLRAIREFTEFGAGFHIAMRDLEIRGAGNLLGAEQHGHMITIGYELYCKLVEDTIKELSGGEVRPGDEMETSIELPVEAHIPGDYIPDELVKLQMYKKIASVRDEADRSEIIDELLDRFGEIPKETLNLIQIALIKAMASRNGIWRVRQEQRKLVFDFRHAKSLDPQKIANAAAKYGNSLFVHGGPRPFIRINLQSNDKLSEAIQFLTTLNQ